MIQADAASVTAFWREAGAEKWFVKDTGFDDVFRERFLDLHYAAAARKCDDWMETAEGALGLMILLDQFPRNCFRGTGHMFATDGLARHFARMALDRGFDQQVELAMRVFFYLPFEHSEDLADQSLAVEKCIPLGGETLRYAQVHEYIIMKYGRFPHRNRALGRETTAAEQLYLDSGGFAG